VRLEHHLSPSYADSGWPARRRRRWECSSQGLCGRVTVSWYQVSIHRRPTGVGGCQRLPEVVAAGVVYSVGCQERVRFRCIRPAQALSYGQRHEAPSTAAYSTPLWPHPVWSDTRSRLRPRPSVSSRRGLPRASRRALGSRRTTLPTAHHLVTWMRMVFLATAATVPQ